MREHVLLEFVLECSVALHLSAHSEAACARLRHLSVFFLVGLSDTFNIRTSFAVGAASVWMCVTKLVYLIIM